MPFRELIPPFTPTEWGGPNSVKKYWTDRVLYHLWSGAGWEGLSSFNKDNSANYFGESTMKHFCGMHIFWEYWRENNLKSNLFLVVSNS